MKYTDKADADHLLDALQQQHTIKADWTGSRYCAFTSTGTIKPALSTSLCQTTSNERFRDLTILRQPDHRTSHIHGPAKTIEPKSNLPLHRPPAHHSTPTRQSTSKQLGTFLFYARVVDNTILHALGTVATQQSNSTAVTTQATIHQLNYFASHPKCGHRILRQRHDLYVESDASSLSETKARSRAAKYHYLINSPPQPPNDHHQPCTIAPFTSSAKQLAKYYQVPPNPIWVRSSTT